VDAGWLLAMPQSSQVRRAEVYAWDDQVWGTRELQAHYADLCQRYAIDPRQVIVGGFSMGARLASYLVLSRSIPARGFVAVGPFLANALEQWRPLVEAGPRDFRGYLIIGDQDEPCYEDTRTFADLLRENGIACELKVYAGMGHTFPPDFSEVLREALAFTTSA
jgi:predicted esterase